MPHRQKQNSTSDKEQPMAKYENIRALAKKQLLLCKKIEKTLILK